ncbi:permease [Stakelama marina]|uniref:Permease n=1 Tax=Stakelama marina TaxID=2826939 RepID=A0A8T4IDY7_9SPHN|nr:permease [Stakelama marina]MBR0552780.1 permease [Stakelama marina]
MRGLTETMWDPILQSLLMALGLLYRALWPILLGVFLTALIETLVDQDWMAAQLGGRGLRSVGKASVAGAVSSACTYGALSITQTLFKKGASAEASFAFAFASTNLVFELGILIYVLLGWQFLLAELLGGFVLIVFMYVLVTFTLPRRLFEESRQRLRDSHPDDPGPVTFTRTVSSHGNWREQLGTRKGWGRIARNYFHTLGVIYKSVLIGFLLAGFIVEMVLVTVWRALFVPAQGLAGIAENAAVGVMAGVLSFIGSIGNVPFAAALWVSGVSFGGVIACIYADLITLPVMALWRRFFGWRGAIYIFAIFYATMFLSAVLMEYVFNAIHWVPARLTEGNFDSFVQVRLDATLIVTLMAICGTLLLSRLKTSA